MARIPACYDSKKAMQHQFALDMRDKVYDNAKLVPYMNCPLCGRNRPLYVKARTAVKPKKLGVYDPSVRTHALDTSLGIPMVRWDHYTPSIDELFEVRVAMPRIRLEDVPTNLRQYCAPALMNKKGEKYWAGGWRYLAGMTLEEINHLLTAGKRAEDIRICWNEWFHGLDQKQLQKAIKAQVVALSKQIKILNQAFESLNVK